VGVKHQAPLGFLESKRTGEDFRRRADNVLKSPLELSYGHPAVIGKLSDPILPLSMVEQLRCSLDKLQVISAHQGLLNQKLFQRCCRLLITSFGNVPFQAFCERVPPRAQRRDRVGQGANVVLEKRQCPPGEQAGRNDLYRAVKKDPDGLVLKPDDDAGRQSRGRSCAQQQIGMAEIKYELNTTIRRDVLFVLGRITRFMCPKALDGILEDWVRFVLAVLHVPTFLRRILLTVCCLDRFRTIEHHPSNAVCLSWYETARRSRLPSLPTPGPSRPSSREQVRQSDER